MTEIEKAFREGYRLGYDQGSDDATGYDWGVYSHPETKRREAEEHWQQSDTKAHEQNNARPHNAEDSSGSADAAPAQRAAPQDEAQGLAALPLLDPSQEQVETPTHH